MTVTLTYDATLSRVQLTADGITDGTTALVERSVNAITWTTVRGGDAVPVVAGAVTLDDYEFSANVVNHYRVTTVNTITFVATGSAATANNANVTPGLPAGATTGDLLLLWTSIRNSGAGTPNVPSGYTLLVDMSNARLFGKIVTGAEVAPTVSFSGGVAGADTLARMAAFRKAQLDPVNFATQLNASQQNIPRPNPPLEVLEDKELLIHLLWKQDDFTSATGGTGGFAVLGDAVSTAGDDAGQSWSYVIQTTATQLSASDAVITGGAAAISRSGTVGFRPTTVTQSNTITPTITGVWLKSITRPFLNRELGCVSDISDITRPARQGVFEVVGRSLPVGVTDVRGSRRFSISTITQTTEQRQDFDLVLASGDPIFLQAPPDDPVPTLYAVIDDTRERRPLRNRTCDNDWRVFTLPLIEVAAPGSDVVGTTSTWQTVLNTYATWSDVIAAKATWADLLTLVGDPSEVIVP